MQVNRAGNIVLSALFSSGGLRFSGSERPSGIYIDKRTDTMSVVRFRVAGTPARTRSRTNDQEPCEETLALTVG